MARDGRKYHGSGVYSKPNKTLHIRCYYVQYYWNGRRITEPVPPDQDGVRRLRTAQRLKAKREREKAHPDFIPPPLKKRIERERKANETDRRAPLLFGRASDRFFKECGQEYA
jgi:hypothetical protein